MTEQEEQRYVDLTRIADPIQAELLAVYFESTDLEFRMLGVRSAPVIASLIPAAQEPIVFQVPEDQLEHGRDLLNEYDLAQAREFVPSEFPPPYGGEDGSADSPLEAPEPADDENGNSG